MRKHEIQISHNTRPPPPPPIDDVVFEWSPSENKNKNNLGRKQIRKKISNKLNKILLCEKKNNKKSSKKSNKINLIKKKQKKMKKMKKKKEFPKNI